MTDLGRAMTETPHPLEPGGLLWESLGELRAVVMLPAALTLQVAHPAVGAGVDEHSVFRTDPWGRAERSLRSVQLWVYGGERARAEGARLRRLHAAVRGTDAHGRPYRALDPRLYGWVHATGFPVHRHAMPYLGRSYTPAEEEQLYAEYRRLGLLLGLRGSDLPLTVAEFWPVYRGYLREIEATGVVTELLDVRRRVPPPPYGPRVLRWVLRALWPLLWPPLARLNRLVSVGLMPPEARAAIGLPWTGRQERRLRRLGRIVGWTVPRLPQRLRYLPIARRARHAVDPGA